MKAKAIAVRRAVKPKVHCQQGYFTACGLELMACAHVMMLTREPRRVTCKTCRKAVRR